MPHVEALFGMLDVQYAHICNFYSIPVLLFHKCKIAKTAISCKGSPATNLSQGNKKIAREADLVVGLLIQLITVSPILYCIQKFCRTLIYHLK